MCYDISFSTTIDVITDYLPDIIIDDYPELDADTAMHVIAQSYMKYPVILFEDAHYKLKMFEWGVIADYMDTPEKIKKGRQWMCNAQSEKVVDDKKSYWHRLRRRRCLIPVTGTFEHREIKGWKNKVPYMIRIKDRDLFCIPGLYHYAPVPDIETGEVRGTFTMLTRAANDVMQLIHNGGPNAHRMPLYLQDKEMEQQWLLPDLSDQEMKEIFEYKVPSDVLEYWPVYTIRSTKPRPDHKSKVDPWEWAGLPPLGNDEGNVKPQVALF